MTNFQELFNNAEVETKKSFEPLEVGKYEAKVSEVSFDASTNKIQFEFNVEKYLDDETRKVQGRKLWTTFKVDHPKGVELLKKALVSLNCNVKPQEPGPFSDEVHLDLVGKRVELFVSTREYNGKTYNNTYINGLVKDTPQSSFDADEPIPF